MGAGHFWGMTGVSKIKFGAVVMQKNRRRYQKAVPAPEGPYEGGALDAGQSVSVQRDARPFLDLIEFLQRESELALGLTAARRDLRMIVYLMRNHFSGSLVTSSSLATASGLTYGTAMRAIEFMLADGMIVKRPKTTTGKSFSLHPSEELLARWQRFTWQYNEFSRLNLEPSIAESGRKPRTRSREEIGAILSPPAVLTTKLPLRQGLRVLVHADPTFMAMRSFKRQQEMMLGVPIASKALSIDRLHEEVIENSKLPYSRYDIIACDYPWFGEMASQKHLLPLDHLMAEIGDDAKDFYPETLSTSRWKGSQYGIPVMMTGELLIYRKDILEQSGISPPRTAAETVIAARKLHNKIDGMAGIAWNGRRGTPLGHTFLMIMAAFGQPIIDLARTSDGFDTLRIEPENLRPMFLSLEARQTAEYLLEILPYSVPNVLDMEWYDRALAYKSGKTALAYSHTMLAPLYETDANAPAYRRTGYLPHPHGPRGKPIVPLGGYGLAVPSNLAPERIKPVMTALKAMTSANAAKLYLINGSLASPRRSVSLDPEVRALSPIVSVVHEMAESGIVRMWPRVPIPQITDIIRIAGDEIHFLLKGEKSIGVALRDAQNRSDVLMRKGGSK